MEPDRARHGFGPLEASVMEAVWSCEEAVPVRRIVDELNEGRRDPLAYTTVMTVMTRLAEKGALSRRKHRRGYLYRANAPDAAGLAVRNVLLTYGDSAVAHFADQAKANPEVLERLRELLGEADG